MKKTKVLTVLGVLLALGVTACGGKGGDKSKTTSKPADTSTSKHTHNWGEWTETPATCTEAGSKTRSCECGESQTEAIPALGHDFGEQAQKTDTFEKEGAVKEEMYKCTRCDVHSIRWSALDYDAEKTAARSTKAPEKRDSNKAIRFDSTANYQDADTSKKGCHIVYNVYIPDDAENLTIEMKTSKRTDNTLPPVVNMVEGDNAKGYEYVNGELVRPATRYGLKIDGEIFIVPEDESGQDWKDGINWYRLPGKHNLTAGIHEIEFYNLGGYRADFYEFALVGFGAHEHDHTYGAKVADNAAGEGYIATKTMACTLNCGKTALQFSAMDYKTDESNCAPASDNSYVRFADGGLVENKDEVEGAGSHIVYYVKAPEALQKAGLAFRIENTGGNSGKAGVFDQIPNDSAQGYVKQEDGTFKVAEKRYGLKVNGVEYFLGDDDYGDQPSAKGWFNWPVKFPVVAGINKIDIFAYHGYRAKMYEFQLTGFSPVEGSVFTLGEEWKSDDNGHYKEAAGQDGVKFMYEEHVLVADTSKTDVAATCEAAGTAYKKCSVCGKEVEQTIPATGHTWVAGEVTVDGTKATQATTCSSCGASSSVTGGVCGTFAWADALQAGGASLGSDGKVNAGDYNLLVFNVPAAGTYVVTLNMQGSNGNGSKVLGSSGQGFAISANGTAGTFLGEGKTYAEFFGENQTTWVDVAFGEVELVAGKNEIKITALNGYNRTRINAAGNVTVAAKAAE